MEKIKILHVASFSGNIGDNASHIGLAQILRKILPSYEIERMEIRRFYKNYSLPDKLFFDENFVNYANSFNLLLIGGGGFLDYWVPNSETGTTIDISESSLKKLTVPTLICSVGCIPHKTVPEGNESKFHSFLTNLLSKKNVRILLRNDGSKKVLNTNFGSEFASIPSILDNGFFFNIDNNEQSRLIKEKYIAINTTLDQLDMKSDTGNIINKRGYVEEMSSYINYIIKDTDYHIVMIPHIFSDLTAFQKILTNVNDFYIRTKIHIAPYTQGDEGCKLLFSIYNNAEFCIGMRFHANICNLAMNKPVAGLAVLDRIRHMHNSIGNDSFVIDVFNLFCEKLIDMTEQYSNRSLPSDIIYNIEQEKEKSLKAYDNSLNEILL